MSKPKTLKIDEIEYVRADSVQYPQPSDGDSHWKVGQNYFIRTVTHHLLGRLILVTEKELVMEETSWIACDGRFNEFLKNGTAKNAEVEPAPDGPVIIGRGSLIDAHQWHKPLLRSVK